MEYSNTKPQSDPMVLYNKDTDSSSDEISRISTQDQTIEKAPNSQIKFNRDFFDQKNQSSQRLRQIIQSNQSHQQMQRKKKREKFISQKRMVPQVKQFHTQSKSTIFQLAYKIQNNQNDDQEFENTISELAQVMRDASEQSIFELIETGICPKLFLALKQSSNLDFNKKLTQIFAILTLGQKREVNKLINSGMILILIDEINNSPDLDQVANCITALGNICATDLDFRNKIIQADPNIFSTLKKFVQHNQNHPRIKGEIAHFVANMITQGSITVEIFEQSFTEAVDILGQLLQYFHFFDESNFENDKLNFQQNIFLYQIIHSFCSLNDMDLIVKTQVLVQNNVTSFLKDSGMTKLAAQTIDQVVNKKKLYAQLLRVLEFSGDNELLEKTWRCIGQLCCCDYSLNNVLYFVNTGSDNNNLIKCIHQCLSGDQTQLSPQILQGCIFTLSNLMADKSIYLQEILELNVLQKLSNIWQSILQKQLGLTYPLTKLEKIQMEPLVQIKNEILYCIGNCTLGIKDALFPHALDLLKQALDQGALTILSSALEYRKYLTESDSLKVALDSLTRYFKFFKKAQTSKQEGVKDTYGQILDQMIHQFELEGLDALEICQYHNDTQVYKMSQKILLKFFEIDSDSEPIIKLLNSINHSKKQVEVQSQIQSNEYSEVVNTNCPEIV